MPGRVTTGIEFQLGELDPLEWTVYVYPREKGPWKKVVHPDPIPTGRTLCEGDWACHPCCGIICMVQSNPLRKLIDRWRFGMLPF